MSNMPISKDDSEVVYLVRLVTSSFNARNEVPYSFPICILRLAGNELVPRLTKNTASGNVKDELKKVKC